MDRLQDRCRRALPLGVARALQGPLGVLFSLSESHPVSGREPATDRETPVCNHPHHCRKQPGWSRLRLRPWLQRCPATWGQPVQQLREPRVHLGAAGTGSSVAHAGLPAIPQTYQSAHRSQLCFYCVQATCDCSVPPPPEAALTISSRPAPPHPSELSQTAAAAQPLISAGAAYTFARVSAPSQGLPPPVYNCTPTPSSHPCLPSFLLCVAA